MSKLCSDVKWNAIFQKYVAHVRDEEVSDRLFPRYEDYSMLARKLPFFLYDNPIFIARCKTAFTTGDAIYMNKDFFINLLKTDEECRLLGRENKANHSVFILLHELAHCLNDDFSRLVSLPSDVANIAQDITNNLSLVYGMGVTLDLPLMKKHCGFTGYGLTESELREYGKLSSDTVGLMLFTGAVEKLKSDPNLGNSQSQSANSPSPELPGEASNPDPVSDIARNILKPSKNDTDDHVLDHNEVCQMARDAGLEAAAINKLGLNPRNKEETAGIEDINRIRAQSACQEMQTIHDNLPTSAQQATCAGTAGGYYRNKVQLGKSGTIEWKAAVSEGMDIGNSSQSHFTEDVLVDEFYSNSNMYDGVFYQVEQDKGCAVFLVDTSGSMPKTFIEDLFTEALASVDLDDPASGFSKILLFPADVDLKDIYWELTADNKDEVIESIMAVGGGGTDFTNPLKNAITQCQESEFNVQLVVFGTDLGAPAPNFDVIEEVLEDEMPPVLFITNVREETRRNEFEAACQGKAIVYEYSEGLEADIQLIQDQLDDIQESDSNSSVTSMGMH